MGNQTKMSEQNGSPETGSKSMARDVGEFAEAVFVGYSHTFAASAERSCGVRNKQIVGVKRT